ISLEEAKLIILDILSTLEQLAKDMDYTMQGRVLDVLKDKYTIEEMCEKIRLDIDVLCTYFIEEYIDENDKKTKIIKYIEQNYQDVNLNVGMVARYLDFNPSYLSRFFKEQTNENLLTYINGYRIDKAKEFLRTTNKTLKVIAAETGFIDSAALSRAFKKYEAITPSQYKNIYGKDLK
ncbi:MAG: AraC family transcriptional regulator, partial [Clostridium sp.]